MFSYKLQNTSISSLFLHVKTNSLKKDASPHQYHYTQC